jgi:2-dehydropantoate 2-reductase
VEVVVVGVRTCQLPEVAHALLALMGPDTYVVSLQNGVEAPRTWPRWLARRRSWGAVVAS